MIPYFRKNQDSSGALDPMLHPDIATSIDIQ